MFGELHPVGWSGMFPDGGTGAVVGGRVLHRKCTVCVCTVRVYGLLVSVYGLQQCLCCVEANQQGFLSIRIAEKRLGERSMPRASILTTPLRVIIWCSP